MYLPNLVYEYQQKHLPALCYLDCNHVSNLIKHIWQNFDGNIKPQHNHDKQTSENNHNNEEQRRTVQEAGEEKLIYMRVITSHNQVHTIHVCLCVHLPCSPFSSNLWKFPLSIICFSQKCSNHHQTTRATSLHFNIQTYMLVHKYIYVCLRVCVRCSCLLSVSHYYFLLLLLYLGICIESTKLVQNWLTSLIMPTIIYCNYNKSKKRTIPRGGWLTS